MKGVTITLIATCLCFAGCDNSTPNRASKSAPIEILSSQQATREVINQFKLWIKVFSGDEYLPIKEAFFGIIELDSEDVVIFDASATGTLTYAYPVPVQSSVIGVTNTGAMVIRFSPRTIPARLAPAIPSIKQSILELNRTPGLQRASGEDLGSWYARALKVLIASMERSL